MSSIRHSLHAFKSDLRAKANARRPSCFISSSRQQNEHLHLLHIPEMKEPRKLRISFPSSSNHCCTPWPCGLLSCHSPSYIWWVQKGTKHHLIGHSSKTNLCVYLMRKCLPTLSLINGGLLRVTFMKCNGDSWVQRLLAYVVFTLPLVHAYHHLEWLCFPWCKSTYTTDPPELYCRLIHTRPIHAEIRLRSNPHGIDQANAARVTFLLFEILHDERKTIICE